MSSPKKLTQLSSKIRRFAADKNLQACAKSFPPLYVSQRQRPRKGFSLLELLAVIAVFGIFASLTMPAVSSVFRASDLRTGAQILREQFGLARQMAIARNRRVEVRLYQFAVPPETGAGKFRAVQLFEIQESGAAVPISRVFRLPGSIIVDAGSANPQSTLSTLISEAGTGGLAPESASGSGLGYSVPAIGNSYQCVKFRFSPDGSTDLNPPSASWFLTLHNLSDGDALDAAPANYCTLQIDPANGRTRIFQP